MKWFKNIFSKKAVDKQKPNEIQQQQSSTITKIIMPAIVKRKIGGVTKYLFHYNGIDITEKFSRINGKSKSLIFDSYEKISHYKDEYLKYIMLSKQEQCNIVRTDEIFVALDILSAIEYIDKYLSNKSVYDDRINAAKQYKNRYFYHKTKDETNFYKITRVVRCNYHDFEIYGDTINYFNKKNGISITYQKNDSLDYWEYEENKKAYIEISEEEYEKHLEAINILSTQLNRKHE